MLMHIKIDISLCHPSRNTCIVTLNFHTLALTPLFFFNTQESISVSYSVLIRNIVESNEYKLKSQLGELLLASNGLWMLPSIQQCIGNSPEQRIIHLFQHFNSGRLRNTRVYNNGLCNYLMEFNTIFLALYIEYCQRSKTMASTILYSISLSTRVTKSFRYIIGVRQVLGG